MIFLLSIIPKKSIDEILIINKIFNGVIKTEKIREFIKILLEYSKDITVKEIELCLKIDKTVDFAELSTKEKKIIQFTIKEVLMENELKKIIKSKYNLSDLEVNDKFDNLYKVEEKRLAELLETTNQKNVDNSKLGILKNILDKFK